MKAQLKLKVGTVKIDDSMVANPDDHNFYDHVYAIGYEHGCLAIVFARHEQDAIDEAVDCNKLDCLQVSQADYDAMSEVEQDECLLAGNASEPFDQSYLWMEEITNPPYSFVAMLIAAGIAEVS